LGAACAEGRSECAGARALALTLRVLMGAGKLGWWLWVGAVISGASEQVMVSPPDFLLWRTPPGAALHVGILV